jgi:hypothetical protein
MAITNLKELVAAISDPTIVTTAVVPRGIDTGTLRVNPLAQTLTNIDAVTSSIPLTVDPLITVVDVGTTAVRTVAAGESVVLITGPQGPAGPPGASGVLGADGRNGIDGVGVANIAVDAAGQLLVELDNGTVIDAGAVNLSLGIGTVTQGSTVGATITGSGLATELNLVLPNTTALGLGNVTNESKLTMFANPTFTGTVSGVTATMVGLGAVTNESKATMFTSPEFTGTPIAPTATAGTNTTQIATTQYVRTEVANLVNSAPGALDTLDELAAALGDDASFATTVTTSIGLKAPLESPAFTGTVTGITKTMIGLGNVLNETKATAFSSPTFTGTVTAPTVLLAPAGFSITQVDTNLLFRYNGVTIASTDSTGTITAPTVLLASGGFSITQESTKLVFKYNGNTIASMDSTGNIISAANVTGFGTP